ncbi:DUF7282 domain-containing protein [Rubrobacter indicoceani]|uniref:DUF7282 domain-containing protein n=1 Tax=Rubrobacter indicoceani TaxID=2051957 RepID=UPI000E5C08AE|nr:hypothetical protein [Rubrobacter indicoceani]
MTDRDPGNASNEQAPPVNENGGGGGGSRFGRLAIIIVALILLLLAVPFACQAIRGGGGGDTGGADNGSPGQGESSNGAASGDGSSGSSGGGSSESTMSGTTMMADSSEETTALSEAAETGSGAVSADLAQVPDIEGEATDGTTVTVPSVALSGGEGWLAVREDDDGEPGEVIGFAPLSSGENEDVNVSLDSPVSGSGELYVSVHRDDPADGAFSFPEGDPTVETEAGETAVAPVSYSLGGPEQAASPTETTSGSGPETALPDTGGPGENPGAAYLAPALGAALLALGLTLRSALRRRR